MKWNNRRLARGAQLYDLWMSLRYDRDVSRTMRLFSLMGALGRAFRHADRHARAGRRSWRKASAVIAEIPMAYSKAGDRR